MASTTRWIIDANWTSLSFSSATSLASGGGILSSTAVANGTSLDQLMDVSLAVTSASTSAASYLTIYLLPLNQDGTTYGDGYAASGSAQPAASYAVGSIGVPASATALTGTLYGISLPPGDFKLVIGNNLGVAFSGTPALTFKYRLYNVNLNA